MSCWVYFPLHLHVLKFYLCFTQGAEGMTIISSLNCYLEIVWGKHREPFQPLDDFFIISEHLICLQKCT